MRWIRFAFALVVGGCLLAALAAQEKPKPEDQGLPLKPTRTFKLTTDEGTWMSLDVSPDGKTIAFDLLGHIYTMPISGGKATRITEGMEWDGMPKFSPDGSQIVFVSDRSGSHNLWLSDTEGHNLRALTKEPDSEFDGPVWLRDGSGVIVARSSGSGYRLLYLYQLAGGTGLNLFEGKTGTPLFSGVTAGPTARSFYAAGLAGRNSNGAWQIYHIDLDHEVVRAQTRGDGLAFMPVLSPNEKYLAYVIEQDNKCSLILRDMATGDDRVLMTPVQHDVSALGFTTRGLFPGYAFTPDGQSIVLTTDGKLWRVDVASGNKTQIPFSADIERGMGPLAKFEYTQDDPVITVRRIRYPQISPDGKRLAFSALNHVWLMDFPSGMPKRISDATIIEDQPAWSPEGKYLTYVTWDDAKGGDIFRINADGSGTPENLTKDSAFYKNPHYTASGDRIVAVRGPRQWQMERAFREGDANGLEMVWLPSNGGETHSILPITEPGMDGTGFIPHFAEDPQKIYFYNPHGDFHSVRFDGTEQRKLFRIENPKISGAGAEESPRDALISPDGTHVVTFGERFVSLATVPKGGPYPPTIVMAPKGVGAAVPVRDISGLGGDYAGWSADGKSFYYALGHSIFLYDIAQADAAIKDGKTYEAKRVDVTIRVPRDRPSGTVVLRGARLLTMKGDEVIENGTIVVTDNKIAAIGGKGLSVPSGARVIDVTGKTILPGYVDLHAHMGSRLATEVPEAYPIPLLAMLAYGVTLSRDPQTQGPEAFSYIDMVETGDIVGSRLLATGEGVFTSARINSLEDARDVARRYSEFYNSQTMKQYESGQRQERQWVVMADNEFHITPTNEGNMLNGLTFAIDGYAGMEHSYNFPSPIYKDVVQLITQSGITHDPTLLPHFGRTSGTYAYRHWDVHGQAKLRHFFPHSVLDHRSSNFGNGTEWYRDDEYLFPQLAGDLKKIVEAGGRVGMGAHGDLPGLGSHFEIWMMTTGGMHPIDALRCATYYGADAIGLGKELGTLEVGKLADLQVLDKNPLANIHDTDSVRYVMKNGRLYDANTLDEIWPRQKKLPLMWWMERDTAEQSAH
jgi:Tol biopolymer transport system component